MPIMDGFESIGRQRKRENEVSPDTSIDSFSGNGFSAFRRQHIIAMSANSDHETMQEALKAGADAFMSKPFSLSTFKERMLFLHQQH